MGVKNDSVESLGGLSETTEAKVSALTLKISKVAYAAGDLDELLRSIHGIIDELMPARNFYIAFYDEETDLLSFPYDVDEYDEPFPPKKPEKGLTEYVLRTGQPLLASPEVFDELVRSGEVELVGAPSVDWLGVPLKTKNKTIGVLAVQSYTEDVRFSSADREMLTFVSTQIAMSIERKLAEEALRESEVRYRSLVENIPVGIYRNLPEGSGYYLMINPAFMGMFGIVSDEEIKGIAETDLFVHPEERETFTDTILAHGSVNNVELLLRKMDGTRIWGSITARVSEVTNGNGVCIDGVIVDITERKRREKEHEALISFTALLRSAQTRSELVSVVLDNLLILMDFDSAVMILFDSLTDKMWIEGARGYWEYLHQKQLPINELVSRGVIDSGKTYVTNDAKSDPLFSPSMPFSGTRAITCFPMNTEEKTIGVIWLGREEVISEGDIGLLIALGDMAANAIYRATLHEQTQIRLQQLSALRTVDMAISSSMDLRVVLNVLLDQLTIHLDVDAAAVLLLRRHMQVLEYASGRGFYSSGIKGSGLRLGDRYVGRSILHHRIHHIDNLPEVAPEYIRERGLTGERFVVYYLVPLVAKGQLVGALELFYRAPFSPDPEWLGFIEMLASQAAIAIDNATLFNDLQRSNMELHLAYDTTLEGWVRALDLRDREEEDHTKRVTDITIQLAREVGISENELVHVHRGALLHDIGKMAIPDSIIQKPGPLSDVEWDVIRQHPVFAKDLIWPIAYLRPAVAIPYCHHEKWDGSGYPRGLKGPEIPLAARVFSLVDVWDALRSKRPYREAWSEEKTHEYLRQQTGKHFDPTIAEKFFQMLESGSLLTVYE